VKKMPKIRPISDLRNNFSDISKDVHESGEPVFLTKNGYGDMVVMSIETFEKFKIESEIFFKLKEAEIESKATDKRYSHNEVFEELKARVGTDDL
jgi:prevent-host-death family protein